MFVIVLEALHMYVSMHVCVCFILLVLAGFIVCVILFIQIGMLLKLHIRDVWMRYSVCLVRYFVYSW